MNKINAVILFVSLLTILLPGCGESTDDSQVVTDGAADADISPGNIETDSGLVQESTVDSLIIESSGHMSRTGGIEPLDTLGIGDPPLPETKDVSGGGQSDMIPPGNRPQ